MTLNIEAIANRVDEIEAKLNGLMLYLAAKEAGVDLDINDKRVEALIKSNLARPNDTRLMKSGAKFAPSSTPGDGFIDAGTIGQMAALVSNVKQALKG